MRQWIDLFEADLPVIEGKKTPRLEEPWTVTRSPIFGDTMKATERVFADIQDKLAKFILTKLPNPLAAKYGKHDGPMTGPLAGFYHCHLRDDAILIYRLVGRTILMICVVCHADIEGKRLKQTAKSLQKFL